jgi:phenylpropionate dioxygenase-like ring-hydroxylating dioxygenase large terminal subunit
LFDACRHRGARVCKADKGKATAFKCAYHGWTYDRAGALDGVPLKKTAYKGLDTAEWGLVQIPRLEIYRGLIFGSLDPNIHSLDSHLGDYKWYLDMHLAIAPGGMELIGEPHRWEIDADWKSGADNFSGDSYHTQSLHQSILRMGLASRDAIGIAGGKNDIHITEVNGHATSIRRKDADQVYFWGYPEEVYSQFSQAELSPAQFELARRSVTYTGTIFPNLSLSHFWSTDAPGAPGGVFFLLRQWKPKGPGKMEVWSWTFTPKCASAEYKAQAYKAATSNFGPSGNFEQDDAITWEGIARSAKGGFAKRTGMKLNYQMGLEFMSEARVMDDWPGPGKVYDTNQEEGVQRTFWNHWYRAMRAGDAK